MTDPAGGPVSGRRAELGPATAAAVLAPGVLVFVLPTISLIARNDEYLAGNYAAGRVLYLLGLAVVVVGSALWALSGTTPGRFAFTAYTLVTPAWLVYRVGGGESKAVAGLVVAVGLLLTAGWLTLRPRATYVSRIGLFGGLVVAVTALGAGIEVWQGTDTAPGTQTGSGGTEDPGAAGDRPNIYHVVLDEMQTEMFGAVLDDDLRDQLGGFTWYSEAATPWGRTEMSMASTLAGDDYDYDVSPAEYIDDALTGPTSSLTRLRELGYWRSGHYYNAGLYGGDPGPFDERHLGRDAEAEGSREGDEQLVTTLWAEAHLPGALADRVVPERQREQLEGDVLLPDEAPVRSVAAFEQFLSAESGRSATGRYELVHLIIPHFPHVLGPDCGYEPGVVTGPEDQTRCALTLVTDLIERLDELGRLADATVIVQGDHGATFRVDDDGGLETIGGDNFAEAWSRARSRPLLLVKPAGVEGDELVESDYPAVLGDIMPTVFDSIGVDASVGNGRTSLLAEHLPPRPRRYYHFYRKDGEGLPDGEVHRYVIDEDGLSSDSVIPVP